MKTIASGAMEAIEAGEAIVTGAVEIIPRALGGEIAIVSFNSSFNYQIVPGTVDTSDPESVVPPASGFDSTGNGPFGHDSGTFTQAYPISTAWAPQTSLWLQKSLTFDAAAELTFSGRVENACLFFLDDELIGSANPTNADSSSASGLAYSFSFSIPSAGTYSLKILALDEPSDFSPVDNTYFHVRVGKALPVVAADPIYIWGGYGPIEIEGDTFQGIGDRGLAQQSAGAVGGFAQGLTLALSRIEPHLLEVLDGDEIKGASVVVRRLIFASDGKSLLDHSVFDRGRVDTIETVETIGGQASIVISVETAARGLGGSGARMRSDADQRLINPTDGYFKHTAFAGEKSLYWGGRKPNRAGDSLGSGGGFVNGVIGAIKS